MSVTMFYRRCIQFTALDSPNVRAGLGLDLGGETGPLPVPGMLTYEEYVHRRKTWDEQRQTEGLDANWYAGAKLMLVPEPWIVSARRYQTERPPRGFPRWAGIDPGEGGARGDAARVGLPDLPRADHVHRRAVWICRHRHDRRWGARQPS